MKLKKQKKEVTKKRKKSIEDGALNSEKYKEREKCAEDKEISKKKHSMQTFLILMKALLVNLY